MCEYPENTEEWDLFPEETLTGNNNKWDEFSINSKTEIIQCMFFDPGQLNIEMINKQTNRKC